MLFLIPSLYEKSVEDCYFCHPATTPPGTSRKQGFYYVTHGRKEVASRGTVGWVVMEAAELNNVLNHL